jgi:hypothetical protein
MHLTRVIAIIAFGSILGTVSAGQHTYSNEEYGIRVVVPESSYLCPPPESGRDHGPVFMIGYKNNSMRGCDIDLNKAARFINIFAGYNAADDSKHLDDLLKSQRNAIGKGRWQTAPSGLTINGLRTEASRMNHRDGWMDIVVVTQAGEPDPDYDATAPYMNYTLWLHTNSDSLDEDLRSFRTMLHTIKISPPPPARIKK